MMGHIFIDKNGKKIILIGAWATITETQVLQPRGKQETCSTNLHKTLRANLAGLLSPIGYEFKFADREILGYMHSVVCKLSSVNIIVTLNM